MVSRAAWEDRTRVDSRRSNGGRGIAPSLSLQGQTATRRGSRTPVTWVGPSRRPPTGRARVRAAAARPAGCAASSRDSDRYAVQRSMQLVTPTRRHELHRDLHANDDGESAGRDAARRRAALRSTDVETPSSQKRDRRSWIVLSEAVARHGKSSSTNTLESLGELSGDNGGSDSKTAPAIRRGFCAREIFAARLVTKLVVVFPRCAPGSAKTSGLSPPAASRRRLR